MDRGAAILDNAILALRLPCNLLLWLSAWLEDTSKQEEIGCLKAESCKICIVTHCFVRSDVENRVSDFSVYGLFSSDRSLCQRARP